MWNVRFAWPCLDLNLVLTLLAPQDTSTYVARDILVTEDTIASDSALIQTVRQHHVTMRPTAGTDEPQYKATEYCYTASGPWHPDYKPPHQSHLHHHAAPHQSEAQELNRMRAWNVILLQVNSFLLPPLLMLARAMAMERPPWPPPFL